MSASGEQGPNKVVLPGPSSKRLQNRGFNLFWFAGLSMIGFLFIGFFQQHGLTAYYVGSLVAIMVGLVIAANVVISRGNRKGKEEASHGYTVSPRVAKYHPELDYFDYRSLSLIRAANVASSEVRHSDRASETDGGPNPGL